MNHGNIHKLRFSVSQWDHLYSLQQAILHTEQASGKRLGIQGSIRSETLLDSQDTPINIHFYQVDGLPAYQLDDQNRRVLGHVHRSPEGLACELPVDEKVFEEMRRNLMEYADIEGIHIVVTLGVALQSDQWPVNDDADLLELDYAMRGDA